METGKHSSVVYTLYQARDHKFKSWIYNQIFFFLSLISDNTRVRFIYVKGMKYIFKNGIVFPLFDF